MNIHKSMGIAGSLKTKVIRAPKAPLSWRIRNTLRPTFLKGWIATFVVAPVARKFGVGTMLGKLEARLIKADGRVINYGVLSYRVVTTAFVNFLVDNLITDSTEFGDFKFHDSGVGGTAENVTDTDMETTDGEARATGTQVEDDPDDYQSVGTINYTTTKAIVEHGVFSQVTGGTLMDRTVFTVINVGNGDSIQFTYTINFAAGS